MSDQLIAVPQHLLKRLQLALGTAIDNNVTIQGLCRIGGDCRDDDTRTCFNAIEACITVQEQVVCPAAIDLGKLLGEAHDG